MAMPCMPKYTAMVYTTQMITRMPMVRKLFSGMPNTRLKAMERRGVARENVVAVPARRAKTAVRSMSLPQRPSTRPPRSGLHASEYFCLFRLRTWSMKPKDTAKMM